MSWKEWKVKIKKEAIIMAYRIDKDKCIDAELV